MSSVVVADDVSPVCDTSDVCWVGYCGFGIIGILKTQYSIVFIGRV